MVNHAEFAQAMGRFASGVAVVTAVAGRRAYGTTATAVSSVSAAPPSLLVCMSRDSATRRAIAASNGFALSLLSHDQAELARRFAVKGDDKFDGVATELGRALPVLRDATAQIECRVLDTVASGTHDILIGEVLWAAVSEQAPLTYFRARFGGFVAHQESHV